MHRAAMASLSSPLVSCQSAVTLETSLSIIPADPTARQQELPRAMTAGALCIRKTDTSTKRKLQAQRAGGMTEREALEMGDCTDTLCVCQGCAPFTTEVRMF